MKNFKPYKNSECYTEIYQDSDLKFALVFETEDSLIQTTKTVMCRDFFNDALVCSFLNQKAVPIYGFKYPTKEYPIQLDKTRIYLTGKDFSSLKENLKLLNAFEKEAKYRRTSIHDMTGNDELSEGLEHIYLTASEVWLRSTVTISLYTHLIRCLYQYEFEDVKDLFEFLERVEEKSGNAASYQRLISKINLKRFMKGLRKIFTKITLPSKDFRKVDRINIDAIHDNGGIVTFTGAIVDGNDYINGSGFKMYEKEIYKARKLVA